MQKIYSMSNQQTGERTEERSRSKERSTAGSALLLLVSPFSDEPVRSCSHRERRLLDKLREEQSDLTSRTRRAIRAVYRIRSN